MTDKAKGTCGCVVLLLALILFCGFAGWLIEPSEEDLQRQAAETAAALVPPVETPQAEADVPEGPTEQDQREASEIKFGLAAEDLPGVASSRVDDFGKLIVQVEQAWHFIPKQLRLQGAQDIGKVWKRCDHSRRGWFSLVDVNGNEVGGSGFTGVWVSE
jgi:hypothetical protein